MHSAGVIVSEPHPTLAASHEIVMDMDSAIGSITQRDISGQFTTVERGMRRGVRKATYMKEEDANAELESWNFKCVVNDRKRERYFRYDGDTEGGYAVR